MTQKLKLEYGAATDIGRFRAENQDTFGIFPSDPTAEVGPMGRLFVVADGMGGHQGGEVASKLAVKTMGESYHSSGGGIVPATLAGSLRSANKVVYSKSVEDPALKGMGTTCVALVVKQSSVFIAHVGDSRVYRISKDDIEQVTEDHTLVADMQRRGMLTAGEAKRHPDRSVLYRALGTQKGVELDLQPEHVVRAEEWYVLCSDGLSNMVTDGEIQRIVVANNPQTASDLLVALANERGGYDNITVIVVRVSPF